MDLDLNVRSRQRMAQRVAVGAELVRDAGNEQSDAWAGHRLAQLESICGLKTQIECATFS